MPLECQESAWSIKSKFIPKDSELTKILFAGHLVVEKLLKIINRKSKNFLRKKITEEEITKIIFQEECNVDINMKKITFDLNEKEYSNFNQIVQEEMQDYLLENEGKFVSVSPFDFGMHQIFLVSCGNKTDFFQSKQKILLKRICLMYFKNIKN